MKKLFSILVALSFVACSKSDDKGSNQVQENPRRINWAAIPSEFNPRIMETNLQIDNIDQVMMDIFGFEGDVEIIYSPNMRANTAALEMYTVYKNSASFGGLDVRGRGRRLELNQFGSYSCTIATKNGSIVSLDGGCIIRLQLILPLGVEIEVYNLGKLLTRRFIPIDAETFLSNIDRATWSDDKFRAIDEYLNSYAGLNKSPALMTSQLQQALHEFMQGGDKLKALAKLHAVVSDRQNLGTMIDDEFTYFDRAEARRIVGI